MLVPLAKLNGAPSVYPSPILRSNLAVSAIGAFPDILHPFRYSPKPLPNMPAPAR
jgi:hypothetical protein